MITPREIIRDYVSLLDLLLQNPDRTYGDITDSSSMTGSSVMTAQTVGDAPSDDAPADASRTPSRGEYEPRKITIDDIVF